MDGLEAHFVHGTWPGNPETYFGKLVLSHFSQIANNTNGEPIISRWGGQNSIEARREGAKKLAHSLRANYQEGRPIIVLGHSHGGNVGIEAINIAISDFSLDLETGKIKEMPNVILITLNTPVREALYSLNTESQKYVTHFNVYNRFDVVQTAGGTDTDGPLNERIYGVGGRTFKGAINMEYEDQLNGGLFEVDCADSNHCGQIDENASKWIPSLMAKLRSLEKSAIPQVEAPADIQGN